MRVKIKLGYSEARVRAYPSVQDQLDTLYNEGFEAWRSQIREIKEKYPKPMEAEKEPRANLDKVSREPQRKSKK